MGWQHCSIETEKIEMASLPDNLSLASALVNQAVTEAAAQGKQAVRTED